MERFLVGIVLFNCGAKLIQSFNAIIGESDACCFWNVNDNGFLFGVVAILFGFTLRAFVFVVTKNISTSSHLFVGFLLRVREDALFYPICLGIFLYIFEPLQAVGEFVVS